MPLSIILKLDFGTVLTVFNLFYSVIILVSHAMMKPVISRYPIKWKHESTVEVNWKSDEMNFPPNMPVNVDLYYPKVGDLFGIFGCVFFFSFFLSSILLLLYYKTWCLIIMVQRHKHSINELKKDYFIETM